MEKVVGMCKELLNEIDVGKYKTFAIRYACRHNSNFTRDGTIKTVADLMPKEWKVDLILYRGRNQYELVLRRPVRKFRDIFHFANRIFLIDFLTQYMNGDWELVRKQH